jgi:hypothetical protein
MRFADPKELEELEMEIAEAERETDIRGHWERARVRAREIGVDLPAYAGNGGIFRIKSGKLEWLAAFDRGIFFGKTPRRSLESLGPAIDEYVRAKA